MPGYADWKQLYEKELFQLNEEGYDVSGAREYEDHETSYRELWKLYGTKLRTGYPYIEPNAFDEIIAGAADVPVLTPLSDDGYRERVGGAVYGRLAGIVLGKQLEMGLDARTVRSPVLTVCIYTGIACCLAIRSVSSLYTCSIPAEILISGADIA